MAKNKAAPHSFVKDGIYYFCRRVPNDLRHHHMSTKISYSLRTRSVNRHQRSYGKSYGSCPALKTTSPTRR